MAETENNETEETPTEAEAQVEEAAPEPPAAAAPRQPAEVVAPKERRRRARAAKAAKTKARQPLSTEERQAERLAERRRKAEIRRVGRTRARQKARAAGGAPAEATVARERGPGRQKTRQGVVVSDKADKTITVRIDIARRHRRYEKIVRTSNTLHAHDEANDAHIGDTVIVRESRPLSRLKRWRLVEVVERAE
jgi:small subunit ribosomal protein S17